MARSVVDPGVAGPLLPLAALEPARGGASPGGPTPTVRRKPTRTLSGVAVVAVMTSPAACPHGRCTYCPGGVDHRSPQSYTGEEPSAMRGAQYGYDARRITEERLRTLEELGHPTSKVEVIVQGGTFPARPGPYRETVFRGIFEGLNGTTDSSLADAQRRNELASRRCVGLTVETRPDWCDGRILPSLLDSGVTRVEMGVECLRDDVLFAIGRAHGTDEVIRATREARDRGLKVCYHLMPGLPGMDPAKDLEDFARLWSDPDLRPDMLKIYPTLVLPDTELYRSWTGGDYEPYDAETAADLIARAKCILPPWVRIQRIQRDIPARLIAAGVRVGNLRQLALARLTAMGRRCPCLRCREVGRRAVPALDSLELVVREYAAAHGSETFLSYEDPASDAVAGFLRLRFPSDRTDGGLHAPVIRELKVLGAELALGGHPDRPVQMQHRGLGRRLVEEAARRSLERGDDSLYVLSAVGTREYYRRLGFQPSGPWMERSLRRAVGS
ncbi:MAG TPA: tRNA uridine(34) 5-carboxymethylaminomethyl modification radical SAM/GNAT enzyme Elp3 [Thermoplasmata archaeon]|nr:tRNA uridine(34) 5-carboxymethylaminomethyl modification radical SAM/GNAT enzyme Elp3 [Thermoplasmata archaeon]